MTDTDIAARIDELVTKRDTTPDGLTEDEATELAALADAPSTDETQTPPPASKRRRSRKAQDDEDEGDPEKRYCAYDLTHGRFIGAVGTYADAKQVIEHNATDHEFEIREV